MLHGHCVFFFFKQKTAYEMRISDWSSDVCSSDLADADRPPSRRPAATANGRLWSAASRLRGRNLAGSAVRSAVRVETRTTICEISESCRALRRWKALAAAINGCNAYCAG